MARTKQTARASSYQALQYACCTYLPSDSEPWQRKTLPLVKTSFHTTILAETQRTVLKQIFVNSTTTHIDTCKYSFPIYDGVSVTSFACEVADRKLLGIVKEKAEAKADFDAAVKKGQKAGLLEQSETADVFSTSLGNVEAGQQILITITYIGELKNDLDNDNIRLTIPTHIAPRYGDLPPSLRNSSFASSEKMDISIDVVMPKDKPISSLESPSHPVSVSLGRLSTDSAEQEPSFSRATATLSDTTGGLNKDFVLLIKAKDTGLPTAVLQTHPTLKNHRALVASLVPKFSLPSARPEVVFVADRSGSMSGNIQMLQQAIKVFLKSLPSGVKFNICSFGSDYSFLWPNSQSYTKATLEEANDHIDDFSANYGGTETLKALEATIKNRHKDIALEIILLTDGDIWSQDSAFKSIQKAVSASKNQIRLFPLGIGNGVSHSLLEGLARAGNGFAQAVQLNERIDTRIVRMLKAALTPHIDNYTMEIKYETEDEFELVEAVAEGLKIDGHTQEGPKKPARVTRSTISLFDPASDPDRMDTTEDKAPDLPAIHTPKLLQVPHTIPSLYSFSRTTAYIIMSPETIQRNPVSVILKAESEHGPLRLEIPVTILDAPGETLHQLAARKASQDLEEHRGWIYEAKSSDGKKLLELYPSRAEDLVKREAVRLGTTYQVANKWCSFVAVEADSDGSSDLGNDELPDYDEALANEQLKGATSRTKESRRPGQITGGIATASNAFGGSSRGGYSARASTGGAAPRRQLASKACRKAAPQAKPYNNAVKSPPSSQPLADIASARALSAMNELVAPPSSDDEDFDKEEEEEDEVMDGMLGSAPATLSSMAMPPPPPAPAPAPAAAAAAPFGNQPWYGRMMNVMSMQNLGGNPPSASRGGPGNKSKRSRGSASAQDDHSVSALQKPNFAAMSDSEKVHYIISLQDFEGYWSYNDDLTALMGISKEKLKASESDASKYITVLVILFLRNKMAAEKEVFELVIEKASTWLQENGVQDGDALFKQAEEIFKV